MPSLLTASDREVLSREVVGASREQMLRAMSEALEALTEKAPLVLILEDFHWSDYSTLDLISYLARQRQPARLMLIGTYRPVDLIVSAHPLKPGEGLRILDEAIAVVNRTGERYYEAELYRLKGELLLMEATGPKVSPSVAAGKTLVDVEAPPVANRKEYFSEAIRIARQQKAKSWELRAVTSLARLLQKQSKEGEARRVVKKIYDRFTEGFDTPDLIEARTILNIHTLRTGAQSSKS